jgi:hypothetical protein
MLRPPGHARTPYHSEVRHREFKKIGYFQAYRNAQFYAGLRNISDHARVTACLANLLDGRGMNYWHPGVAPIL